MSLTSALVIVRPKTWTRNIICSVPQGITMRFLLHPRQTAASRFASPAVDYVVQTSAPKTVPRSCSVVDTSAVKAFGQQCSVDCGCVVRFSTTRSSSGRLALASYTAKTVVTTGRGQPVMTTKGRPMLGACRCPSLHHLAGSLVEHYLPGSTMARLRSDLEFHTVRSSEAFMTSVLKAQGLPDSDRHCFDVVEEAWTAMVKGYLPQPRRRAVPVVEDEGTPVPTPWTADDEDHALPFGQLWKTSAPEPSPSSTLSLFDAQQVSMSKPMRPAPPTDWVSYVDELRQQDESA